MDRTPSGRKLLGDRKRPILGCIIDNKNLDGKILVRNG
jgi:hypothetical protein